MYLSPSLRPPALETQCKRLETQTPLQYPGSVSLTEQWIGDLIQRLHAASFGGPNLLSQHVCRRPDIGRIVLDARELLRRLPNIVDVTLGDHATAHVIGDLHGHLHDLLAILSKFGWPSERCIYVFDGDFVDRGAWGVETTVLLFVLKLKWPHFVHLVRGNHETTGTMCRYGFEAEVKIKYDTKIFRAFVTALKQCPLAVIIRTLPIAASPAKNSLKSAWALSPSKSVPRRSQRIQRGQGLQSNQTANYGQSQTGLWRSTLVPGERRVLVVHGGLFRAWLPKVTANGSTTDTHIRSSRSRPHGFKRSSRPAGRSKSAKLVVQSASNVPHSSFTLGSLEDLAAAHRQTEDPYESLVEDVMWSDPQIHNEQVAPNERRGAGILYGRGAVEHFLQRNRLHGIIRGHEGPDMRKLRPEMGDVSTGYSLDMEFGNGRFVCTVFSASDYPMDDPHGNHAAVASISGRAVKVPGSSLLPTFTTLPKPARPKHVELYYDPTLVDRPATPRQLE